jgi:glutamyl-tRNA synthetase
MSPGLPPLKDKIHELALRNAIEHDGVARWEGILNRVLALYPELRSEGGETAKTVREEVQLVNDLSAEEKQRQWKALPSPSEAVSAAGAEKASGDTRGQGDQPRMLPPLLGAEQGKVVLRFAPFPSGALHIGSARGIFLNDAYRQMYHGKFYIVFDDTVGSEEKRPIIEAYDLIREDLAAAAVTPDAYFYKSDRMDLYYRHLPSLLEKRAAYVCFCPGEVLKKRREIGEACPERDQPVDWQLQKWGEMLDGKYGEGEAVVRLKTDMKHPNPAFRDRVLFRISKFNHPRVGNKYCVWPMLEYAFAIDDVELGVTHVLRGKDLVMEDMMETAIWDILGLKGPAMLHWGILRVRDAKISKSKSYMEVKNGTYDGWSDPRTWSFSSLARRGIRPEAIRGFVMSFGMSLADIEVPAETLYAENRRLLDPVTERRSFVANAGILKVDWFPPEIHSVNLANHPDKTELGTRTISIGDGRFFLPLKDLEKQKGKEIRLKDLVNVQLPPTIGPSETVAKFTTRANKPIQRIQWVPEEGAVPVSVLMVDGTRVEGMGEPSLAEVKEGDIYQFERFGFVRADKQDGSSTRKFVFGHP